MSGLRFLVLGGGDGWHWNQLLDAAKSNDCELAVAEYESLRSSIDDRGNCEIYCNAGRAEDFDAILTRTMPAGSLEQITFRLATLHHLTKQMPIVNSPRGLEVAIDKFATVEQVRRLGYPVPPTIVVQSRSEAMRAFDELGGDCIVKPIFGGEGRGVSRIRDRELAWYAFSTLEQLNRVLYVQQFIGPGGSDTRMLVIGDEVIGVRRENANGFRTNHSDGARPTAVQLTEEQITMARRITTSIGLLFASVDVIDSDDGTGRVLEVNAVPGWRSAQSVVQDSIADKVIGTLIDQATDWAGRSTNETDLPLTGDLS
tara:strand:- start:170981 stop:171922 length:942 start_codon:yes stop_codon:yes gene_type:complete